MPTTTVPAEFLVSPGRVGRLRAGMTVQEAKAAGLARRVREGCDPHWKLTTPGLYGVFDLYDLGDIDRIDIFGAPRYRTAAGIGVGSTVADVRRAYGSRLWLLPDYPDSYPALRLLALTTETGSIIFQFDPAHSTTVNTMTVIATAEGEDLRELVLAAEGDPC
ncbi:MAG: hypothetical protein ACXWH0_14955 [Acidimicrobiia bacterium]